MTWIANDNRAFERMCERIEAEHGPLPDPLAPFMPSALAAARNIGRQQTEWLINAMRECGVGCNA